jgi:endonuclease G, mitochondrial
VARRRRQDGRGSTGFRAAVVSAIGAVVATAVFLACRPDLWLEDAGSNGDDPRSKPSPSARTAPTARSARTAGAAASGKPPRASSPQSPAGKPGAAPPSAGEAPSDHLAMGTPADKDPSDDHLMVKTQYALSYNKDKNVPNWVSYSLAPGHFGDVPRFKGKFLQDDSLPEGFYRVKHDDYVGSGYDRGHMVRSEERTRTPEDNKATFLLTNILPQRHDLNAGPWLRLEEHCEDLARKQGRQLYVVAGGVYPKKPETIGKGVAVPESCFKIVVVLNSGEDARHVARETRVIAVVMPNKEGILDREWEGYRTTVDDIERRTGYDFLTRVPADVQAVIEARSDSGP